MNAYGAELWGAPGSSKPNSQLRLRKTNSGFAVTDTSDRVHRNALEWAFKAMSLFLVLFGGVVLFTPGSDAAGGWSLTKLGIAVAMTIVGYALFVYSGRGLGPELHVDPYLQEIRVGTVNARGEFALRRTIPAKETQSFFLIRAASPAPATLCMRRKQGGQVIKIIKGSEAELIPILERISEAFRPKHLANKRVRTRITGAFVHASFH